ncbi:YXWGXW repeat-containing protein [Mucilaginibacter agri]|uniref:BcpO-related WXXGXW repeat protein n=1 Tax=Mucilaginibacter agri TaxID=2695265 RepID=A0A965ZJH1_9SPHI|nr:YXWGXW repeat-containing protein [Mucilaginibacter agri]NCD72270.1 BcpO-related WXXGXW repeat protein [Mucilaginibacter agri]
MKNIAKTLIIAGAMSLAASASHAQVVVRVRPVHTETVVVTRPARPTPAHVWVKEEWGPRGNAYVWHGGYWAAPPRRGAVYVAGHWRNTRHGYVWIPGQWR